MQDIKSYTKEEIKAIYHKPLLELLHEAATVHRQHHNPQEIQVSQLVSIKTGGCPEDCGYCPQSASYDTNIEKNQMMPIEEVLSAGLYAKENGSSRVCMGAAWRNVKENEDFDKVLEMVRGLNDLDLEVCCTLGMLTENQAKRLADAGLYAYNHNLDSSEDFYKKIISTRGYDDRLKTIDNARKAGLTVCSGGIIGMGEADEDRIGMLYTLQLMRPQPESVPINALVAVEGTPLEEQMPVPIWDMVRMIATTRIVMPYSAVRLSAGRTQMSDEGQALCFMAGANSIFSGEKLLTTPNPDYNSDRELFDILGLHPMKAFTKSKKPTVNEKYKIRSNSEDRVKWSRPAHKIDANEAKKHEVLSTRENFEPRKISVE
ncbi:MAG: biotin synthase BioB [Bacteroidia bacterium]